MSKLLPYETLLCFCKAFINKYMNTVFKYGTISATGYWQNAPKA